MTATINASTSSGVVVTSDTSGSLALQSNGTTQAIIGTNGFQAVGTNTNDNASTGYIGEYVSSTVASNGVSMTSGTVINITSISLTAGDWDVSGVVGITNTLGTTTYTYINYGSSSTSATIGNLGQGGSLTTNSNIAATVDFIAPIPTTRFSLASTTTIYLIARASFATSNSYAYGVIRARRAR